MFEGDIYLDGSALDGPTVELMRCGRSFVVLRQQTGKTIASAFGVPPSWITCIGGAEAWAMLQAALRTTLGDKSSKAIANRALNAIANRALI